MEFDILFARTFLIVGGMLIITAIASALNKSKKPMGIILSLIGLFGLLFVAMMFSDQFPLNILLVSLFAAFMGWIISPTIHGL
jgi:FtsH-binding integral membrane protein